MADRPLPQSDQIEQWVLGRILSELATARLPIVSITKGDQGEFTFDWLIRTEEGCIGLEVVRAEDKDQLDYVEGLFVQGKTVAVGSMEVAWESLARQFAAKGDKATKAGGYREQLDQLAFEKQSLELAVTSWGQSLDLTPELIWPELEKAIGPLDSVWLVTSRTVERRP